MPCSCSMSYVAVISPGLLGTIDGSGIANVVTVVGFGLGLYHWVFYADLITRAGNPDTVDIVVGVIVVALVFEAGRRMMGPMLPIICAIFLSYGLFGQYLPSPLQTRGYDFYQVVDQMFLGTE